MTNPPVIEGYDDTKDYVIIGEKYPWGMVVTLWDYDGRVIGCDYVMLAGYFRAPVL